MTKELEAAEKQLAAEQERLQLLEAVYEAKSKLLSEVNVMTDPINRVWANCLVAELDIGDNLMKHQRNGIVQLSSYVIILNELEQKETNEKRYSDNH